MKDGVLERLSHTGVSLIVVDETHCVAAWGTMSGPTSCGWAR